MPRDKQDDRDPSEMAGPLSFKGIFQFEGKGLSSLVDELRRARMAEASRRNRPGPLRSTTDNHWGKRMTKEQKVQALQDNVEAHKRGGTPLDGFQVAELLDDMGERWREVWTMMPRDQVFDSLYVNDKPDVKFPFLLRSKPDDVMSHTIVYWHSDERGWECETGPSEIVEFLIDTPPFAELAIFSRLYQHSAMIRRHRSPWVLLMALIGVRKLGYSAPPDSTLIVGDTSAPTGLPISNLFPVGRDDADVLGTALSTWGTHNDTSSAYIHLVDAYDGYLLH